MAARAKPAGRQRAAQRCVARLRRVEGHELSLSSEQPRDVLNRHAGANGNDQIGALVRRDPGEAGRHQLDVDAFGRIAHAGERSSARNEYFLAGTIASRYDLAHRLRIHRNHAIGRRVHGGVTSGQRMPLGKIFSGLSIRAGSKTSRTRAIVARSAVE